MTESQGVRRKRALSFAGYTDLPKLSSGVPITQLPTIGRSRRPSCICSGDYSAASEVFKDISNKLNSANSNAEFSCLSEFRVSESPDLCSRKTSVATVVRGDSPCSYTSTPQMSPRQNNSYSDLLTLLRPPELSDHILPDGPLSSNLVKLYLAKLTKCQIIPINDLVWSEVGGLLYSSLNALVWPSVLSLCQVNAFLCLHVAGDSHRSEKANANTGVYI
ncbi:unnamed protein product [Trichobilharzia regenti]|nr:unnamed protein product [Trichobilharzia regenti]